MVPQASIAFMTLSLLIAVGLPVALLIAARLKFKARIVPVLVGAGVFVLFALILEQLLHLVVFNILGLSVSGAPVVYVVYAILAAGVFEETGRFIAFKLLRKKYRGVETGLAFGIGHGGAEALLLVGLTMVSNIVLSIMINNGSIDALGNSEQIALGVNALTDTAPVMFLLSGIERAFAISVQISLSVIVWCSVNHPRKTWLFPVAIALHAMVDLPAALTQVGVIGTMWITEALLAVCAVAVAMLAVVIYRSGRCELWDSTKQ
jgi:uncharacterized membrane protein YhfC